MPETPDPPMRPRHIDLVKDRALTITWPDGRISVYPITYLRKMSPDAETKDLQQKIASNPLTVLPSKAAQASDSPLTATGAELVGRYAIRVRFSDGHDVGIYSWRYLRQIDPGPGDPRATD